MKRRVLMAIGGVSTGLMLAMALTYCVPPSMWGQP